MGPLWLTDTSHAEAYLCCDKLYSEGWMAKCTINMIEGSVKLKFPLECNTSSSSLIADCYNHCHGLEATTTPCEIEVHSVPIRWDNLQSEELCCQASLDIHWRRRLELMLKKTSRKRRATMSLEDRARWHSAISMSHTALWRPIQLHILLSVTAARTAWPSAGDSRRHSVAECHLT